MLKKLKYFAVAVTDIEEGIKLYETFLGLKRMTPIEETRWGFRRVMMGDGQQAWVEIMQPQDPNSALARFMGDNVGPGNPHGQGVYVVAFETDNVAEEVERIRAGGGRVTTDPSSPNSAWIHPLSMRNVFIELQQARQQQG